MGSPRVRLARDLNCLGVSVCCVYVTDLQLAAGNTFYLGGVLYLACFEGCSGGIFWLVSKFWDAVCALVFADSAGRLCVLGHSLHFIGFNAPKYHAA